MMVNQFARLIANIIIALDFAGETIEEDDIVNIINNLGHDLLGLDAESRKVLSEALRNIAPEYEGKFRKYVENIPDAFGLDVERDI